MTGQSLQTLIQQTHTNLPGLLEKIGLLQVLNGVWHKYLDMQLTKHTRVANWRDNCLIIEVDSAAWATHVRYLAPDLLRKLKTEPALANLKTINWYIKPATASPGNPTHKMNPLSSENSQMLLEAAEHIENEKLKKALARLAENEAV